MFSCSARLRFDCRRDFPRLQTKTQPGDNSFHTTEDVINWRCVCRGGKKLKMMEEKGWMWREHAARALQRAHGLGDTVGTRREADRRKRLKPNRRLWCCLFSRDKVGQLGCCYGALWWSRKESSASETPDHSEILVQENTTLPWDRAVKQPLRRDADITAWWEGTRKIQFLHVRHQSTCYRKSSMLQVCGTKINEH